MQTLNLFGSQAGWLIIVVCGVLLLLLLNKFGFFTDKEEGESCLEKIFIIAFLIAGACAWLYTCAEIAQE